MRTKAHPSLKNSARDHSEDQIRSGSRRGGLPVGSMGSLVVGNCGWRGFTGSIERFAARVAGGFQRASIVTVTSRPTQEKAAVTLSSVSLAGTTPLSQESHSSSNGVSVASSRTAAIASWKIRRTTLFRIDAGAARLQFRAMTFLSCLRAREGFKTNAQAGAYRAVGAEILSPAL